MHHACHIIKHHLSNSVSESGCRCGHVQTLYCLQIKMRDLLIKVGRYPCGSLDVEVSSSGLAIADKRHVPHMPEHLSVITITPDQPDGAGGTSDVFAPWDTVRGFVGTSVFMPEFSRLAHRSSFERRHSIRRATSSVSSVLNHRRASSDSRLLDDKFERTGRA